MQHWYVHGLKDLVIGSSDRPSVFLYVCLSEIASRLQIKCNIKVWVVMQQPNLDCSFTRGLHTLPRHHAPVVGWGAVKTWYLKLFVRFWLCCGWGIMFHKHMSNWDEISGGNPTLGVRFPGENSTLGGISGGNSTLGWDFRGKILLWDI